VPHDLGDPLLSAWILWWNAHHLPFVGAWWDGLSFYPGHGSLAFSDHRVGLSLIAGPVQWLGGTPIEMRDTKPVRPGATVHLTLDAKLQDQAEEVLGEVGKAWQPKGATMIVMDPNSGAVLALANWPQVNANAPLDAPDFARRDRAKWFFNRTRSTMGAEGLGCSRQSIDCARRLRARLSIAVVHGCLSPM